MYVARWQFTARFGHKDDCLKLLQKWDIDVAQRIGWRSIRVLAGGIGVPETQIELEVKLDGLDDLEAAFRDLAKQPYHAEYQKQLADFIVSGSDRWTILGVADMSPPES